METPMVWKQGSPATLAFLDVWPENYGNDVRKDCQATVEFLVRAPAFAPVSTEVWSGEENIVAVKIGALLNVREWGNTKWSQTSRGNGTKTKHKPWYMKMVYIYMYIHIHTYNVYIYIYLPIYLHVYIYIYICIFSCVNELLTNHIPCLICAMWSHSMQLRFRLNALPVFTKLLPGTHHGALLRGTHIKQNGV